MSDMDLLEQPVPQATPVETFPVSMAGVVAAVVVRAARDLFPRCRLARVGVQVMVGQELLRRLLARR